MDHKNLNYLADKIQKSLWKTSQVHFNMIMNDWNTNGYDSSEDRSEVLYRLRDLHERILCFLEMKGLDQWLSKFKNEFTDEFMRDDNNLLANDGGSHDHDPELLITSRFYSYLTVFSEFEPNHVTPTSLDKIQHPYEGEKVLAEVLKNTQHIVEHIELIPKNEADIYKAVYWFVKLVFASSRRINKSRFIKSFSTYKPDLLIPELNIAVEYKLIRTPKDLATHIDQVKIDADNYTGDPEYNKFYAVFYICEQKITTESSFLLAWEEKNFPDSWKPILVFGAKL